MRNEQLQTHYVEPKERHVESRAIIVSLCSGEEIYESIQRGKPTVLRFYVKKQEDTYTLMGGRIKPEENFSEATQREITKNIGCTFLGMPQYQKIGEWRVSTESKTTQYILTYCPILPSKEKEGKIAFLTLEELEELFDEMNDPDIFLDGYSSEENTYAGMTVISREDEEKKREALSKSISWMRHIENSLRKKIEQIATVNDELISKESFLVEYQKIVANFMKKGLHAGTREKQTMGRNSLVECLDGRHLGKDILYFLPEFAKYGINWSGKEHAPESVKVFIEFIHESFTEFLQKQGISEEEYRLLMQSRDTSLEKKISFVNTFDQFFKEKLQEILDVSHTDIQNAEHHVQHFLKEISNEIKVADPQLSEGLYQDFAALEEVDKANIGQLVNIVLFHRINTRTDHIIRFEAGRKLVLLLKSLIGIRHYYESTETVRNSRLRQALHAFFGEIDHETIIPLDEQSFMRARVRKNEQGEFILDEKPAKPFGSYLRKSFEEHISDINDVYSASVVFLEDKKNQQDVENLIILLTSFLKKEFPSFEVSIEGKRSYGSDEYFNSHEEDNIFMISGKRKGSQGDRLIRTKLFVVLHDGNKIVEKLDLVIYPVYSTRGSKEHFWGWLEKIKDDKHYSIRRLFTGKNGIPSLFHLLYPPEFYPHNYQCKLRSQFYRD